MGNKQWTIPTILRELRRVVLEVEEVDIMTEDVPYKVQDMVKALTTYHMGKQMELPGQTSILTETKDKK